METAVANKKPPLSQRINFRMIAVAAVVMFLVGYPVYLYVDASVTGGAKNVGGTWAVDLKALGNFPFDDVDGTVNDIPAKWRELDGKKVALEGFMFSTDSASDDISAFQFVYNITKCCFNGPPKVQERVFAHTTDARTVPYSSVMVRCIGTLHVHLHKNEAGKTDVVYDMNVERVEQI